MELKIPQNTERFEWTLHSIAKMKQYGLSENRVKRVINNPKRKEVGIAPKTIAVMQPNSSKHSYEFWAMYSCVAGSRFAGQKIRIITAWKYPGRSPIKGPIPIPLDILEELGDIK
jgi:hypothetical protein